MIFLHSHAVFCPYSARNFDKPQSVLQARRYGRANYVNNNTVQLKSYYHPLTCVASPQVKMRSPSEENPSDNQLFATSCDALRLRTQDAKPVVEGDDDDRAEGGEYARVPKVSRSPLERLSVHVDDDWKRHRLLVPSRIG